jgi:hypothetical protein
MVNKLVTIFAVNTAQRRTTLSDGTCKKIHIQYTYCAVRNRSVQNQLGEETIPWPFPNSSIQSKEKDTRGEGAGQWSVQSPYFLNVYGAQNRFQGMNSASLCSLAGQYDNPIPTPFLAPIDCLKIPAR